jgi:ketosteroid isomerase-like protein
MTGPAVGRRVPAPDPEALVRGYYRAIDEGDYDALASLLSPKFRQVRGDLTIDGREAFVQFMREERPETTTRHEVDAVYHEHARREPAVAVRGRLYRPDGSVGFGFVDVFEYTDDRLDQLVTYTNQRVE